jgi:hypothetical protein
LHPVGKSIYLVDTHFIIMPLRKIGISVDEKIYEAVKGEVETGDYRNISHFFEKAARLLLESRIKEKGQGPCEALAS